MGQDRAAARRQRVGGVEVGVSGPQRTRGFGQARVLGQRGRIAAAQVDADVRDALEADTHLRTRRTSEAGDGRHGQRKAFLRHGWFSLSPLCRGLGQRSSGDSTPLTPWS